MTTKPKNHSTYESFVMLNFTTDIELTPDMQRLMSGPWRVWTVSLNRLNNFGHAPFRPGELPTLVCGEDTPSTRQMVRDWIRKLSALGWIAPPADGGEIGSTPLCIVVNHDIAKRDAGRAMDHMCSEPKHFDCRRQSWPATATTNGHGTADVDDSADDDVTHAYDGPGLDF